MSIALPHRAAVADRSDAPTPITLRERTVLVVGAPAPAPLPWRSEAEVMATWRGDTPVVSVLCATYQHAGFIEDALRGFMGQVTDFPFEVIVRDDGSTDGTAAIVAEVARRYPRIVRAVLEPVNTWPAVKPLNVLMPMARGEFVAICEGDDYWIAPDKLAVQVAGLRAAPSAVLSHHDSVVIRDGAIESTNRLDPRRRRGHRPDQLRRAPSIGFNSVMIRNVDSVSDEHARPMWTEDVFLSVRVSDHGGAIYEPSLEAAAVYRRHPGGLATRLDDRSRPIAEASSSYWVSQWLVDEGDTAFAGHHLVQAARHVIRSGLNAGVDPRRELVHALRREDGMPLAGFLRRWDRAVETAVGLPVRARDALRRRVGRAHGVAIAIIRTH